MRLWLKNLILKERTVADSHLSLMITNTDDFPFATQSMVERWRTLRRIKGGYISKTTFIIRGWEDWLLITSYSIQRDMYSRVLSTLF